MNRQIDGQVLGTTGDVTRCAVDIAEADGLETLDQAVFFERGVLDQSNSQFDFALFISRSEIVRVRPRENVGPVSICIIVVEVNILFFFI